MSSTRAHDGWRPAMGLVVVSVLAGLAAPPPIAGPALAVAGAPASKPARVGVTLDGQTAFAVPAGELGLASGPISVAAWVRLKDTKAPQAFVNCGDANTMFTLYAYNDAVRMLVGSGASDYTHADAALPAAGEWVHYVGTYDGKQICIYRDGKLAAAVKQATMTPLKGKVYIGAIDEHERFLTGAIDDVRIWRRALNETEAAAVAAGQELPTLARDLAASYQADGVSAEGWASAIKGPAAKRISLVRPELLINQQDDGYRGIWYMNQPSGDEYVYKYSGGMGTYCANHIPHAWYAKAVNKTFFTYGGTTHESNTHLMHMVSYYDHATGTVPRPTILLDKQTDDAHDNPVINLDDKGYIWIFSSSHGTGRPSYISRSVKPYDISAFELVWTGNFSYPQPWHIPGRGFLFMHTYYSGGRTICMMTSPDGKTWSERRMLSKIDEGHYQVSRLLPNGRVGTFFNYHPKGKGLNWRTNVYYMESADFGATWTTAGGTPLTLPLTQIDNPALVAEYRGKGLNMYTIDLTADAQGRPVLLYLTSKGYESGPKNMPRTWTTARWTGKAWDIAGGDIVSDNNYDLGSLYIEAEDRWRIIGPTQPGPQPYNPGGQIAMWLSGDQGHHWTMEKQMTHDAEYNHTFVRRPVNADPGFYGFWADGHGRKPSSSRLYFCTREGQVYRLPFTMTGASARPELVE